MNNMNAEYESLFSPSKWAKRFSSEEVVEKHVQFINKYSDNVRKQIKCQLDVPYGPGEREKYNIFGTNLCNDVPILFYIHGGYYQEESITHTNSSFIANALFKHKIKSIIIGYEVSPKKTVLEILDNLQNALKHGLKYAQNINSRGVYLCGHSAGAHALATFFTNFRKSLSKEQQNLIKGIFLISGLYNFKPITQMSANLLLNLTEETAESDLSPLYKNLDYGSTKLYVIVGEHDSPAFIKQAKQFFKKLQDENIQSELNVVANVDHFDIIENLNFEEFELTKTIIETINTIT